MTDSTAAQPLACSSAYVVLASQAFEPLVAFYQAFLGQDPHPHWPQRYAEFTWGGLRLGIFSPQASHAAEFQTHQAGAMSLCLEVADLDRAIAHLTRLGYPPPGPILTASHGREIYAYDPDGNRLILHQSPATVGSPAESED
ncbi:glyoxalase/bleomycin resistance/dioxygenase family protein [Leptolyngbya sp. BL0902]|uniref:VOC family protein n=1 Tax=Leptolyngbya sp. BL0902 TaxID=1115757 RepID=UPI001938655A|nr:VOC family protein [Leptolyngbya sp. BL0902]QQE63510.1 glyoxalase/bleomycin resistance/dioxygenase family protein [Leptolyngbya sp. BL0902]